MQGVNYLPSGLEHHGCSGPLLYLGFMAGLSQEGVEHLGHPKARG